MSIFRRNNNYTYSPNALNTLNVTTVCACSSARLLKLQMTIVLLGLLGAGSPPPIIAEPQPAETVEIGRGVVVEKVARNGEGEKAGVKEGDVLLSWSRGDNKGDIQSPFDLVDIEIEQAPLGSVELEGLRGTEKQDWTFGADTWGVTVRPNFSGQLLSGYLEGEELAKSGNPTDVVKAAEHWAGLANQYSNSQAPWLAAWLYSHSAEALQKAKQWKESDDEYRSAIQSAADPVVAALLMQSWGKSYQQRNDWTSAERCFQLSITKVEKLSDSELILALSLNSLGNLSARHGVFDKAEQYYRQALDIREKLAPGSLVVASIVNNLGNIASERGDLEEGRRYLREALDIKERLTPESLAVSGSLNNLGIIAERMGHLAEAEEYYRKALRIQERVAPESFDISISLDNLAAVASERGDFAKADAYDCKALEIRERITSESLDVSAILTNLGGDAWRQGNLAEAEKYSNRALQIIEKLAPESLDAATTLHNLGLVEWNKGNLEKAEQYCFRALKIQEKVAPESLHFAQTMDSLGYLMWKAGDTKKAERYYRHALAIREKLAPGSKWHAESLAGIASVLQDEERLEDAARYYTRAADALESQTAHLGGSDELRSTFRANHLDIYQRFIELLVLQNQPNRALEILERSRARTLLEILSAAHLDIHHGADPSLLKQEQSLKELLSAKSQRRLQLLGDKNKEKQVAAFTQEIEDLKKQYQDVEERLRLTSPAYAALTQPQPLTASEIQQLLDSDTLLLEYSLGDERSYLFAVTRESIAVHDLPKRAEIEKLATEVRKLLVAPRAPQAVLVEMRKRYTRAAAALSHAILGPVTAQLPGKRLLIVADGALEYIPFAVLPGSASSAVRSGAPLIVEHEIVSLPSASVLQTLRQQAANRKPAPKTVAVLADPVFSRTDARLTLHSTRPRASIRPIHAQQKENDKVFSEAPFMPEDLTRSATEMGILGRGADLPRLRFSRVEAEAILELTPSERSLAALDFQANRELATSPQLAQYRVVHFATHGLLNNQHPELSGLVLSLVDEHGKPQDGFLELQDIYNLDLPVDLIVLSACESGLGKEIQGEGLIGLTRGFMYAGASRVVASLWNVSDVATAALMKRFYLGMEKDGLTPAAALRQAQMWMRRQPEWKFPYYWGAFQLQGDWK